MPIATAPKRLPLKYGIIAAGWKAPLVDVDVGDRPSVGWVDRAEAEFLERGVDVLVVGSVGEIAAAVPECFVAAGVEHQHRRQGDAAPIVGVEQLQRLQVRLATRVRDILDVGRRPAGEHRRLALVVVDGDGDHLSPGGVDAV